MNFIAEGTYKNLNLDYIFNEIKPITEYGMEIKREVKPFVKGQESELKEEFNKIKLFLESDKRNIIDELKHYKNISETIKRAFNNHVLDEVEIFEVKNFLIQSEKMYKLLKNIKYNNFDDLTVIPLPELYNLLDPASERISSFYIYNEYSEKLTLIRNEKKEIENKIKEIKKSIKFNLENKYKIKSNLKEEFSVNKSEKEKIEGLLKENYLRINSENYLNIIFEIRNDENIDELEKKKELLIKKEEEEEFLIRQNISLEIKNNYNILFGNVKAIGKIDYLIAKANYAQKLNLVEPILSSDLEIEIKSGRNLKLEKTLKEKQKDYTPIYVYLNNNVTCITGANMGGKTVSLKMIGQIVAMASYGIYVPCQYAKLCLFEYIHISVGDDQSIEKGLSTFGAEIVNLKDALNNTDKRSLILIDELAVGTNPKEGYAITKAVVNYLKKCDCITVLTTHYDNIANDKNIKNLQVAGLNIPDGISIKDSINEISKYMDYSLIEVDYSYNIPKDAIKIAKLAGINEEIIREAEKYIIND